MVENGFELLAVQDIEEINSRAKLFRHLRTGAQLLSLENDDENKVFGITFRTPPTDSTGVAHIMEHSVLCGSQKYPVKEPFVELVKGSLNTFLNAFTYPDKTCYPVASQNLNDFYNLIDVYVDAVFHPMIPEHILQQEGWHYELETLESPLTYKGVVFNEMKGAYSDPNSLLYRAVSQSLFPDNPYGVDSGGDPREIPNLTYESFIEFHRTFYHPSNSYIFFYGDDDPQERLRRMDEYLQEFDAKDVNSSIPLQTRFEMSRRFEIPFDPGEEASNQKGMLVVNWLLTDDGDPQTMLGLSILSHILVGTAASPLRKALIDSGLGEDLAGAEFDSEIRQAYFSIGLKGLAVDENGNLLHGEKVEHLICETLEALVENGIDPDTVAASLNTVEFHLRENNTGSYPRGLLLMLRSLTNWLYDLDPMLPLAFEGPLGEIKDRLGAGEDYFEDLIANLFLENQHRTTVIMKPEPGLNQQLDEIEQGRLEDVRSGMSSAEIKAILKNSQSLKQIQETPDSPDALATIPLLQLEDLDKENKLIPLEVMELKSGKVLFHDLFTNNIVYLDLGFDLHALSQDLLPYISLFGRALTELGTNTEDFVKLSQRIGSSTGGIYTRKMVSSIYGQETSAAWLFLRGKATMENAEELLAILSDILLTVNLDNRERFMQMVLEEKASIEAGLVPAGHRVVNTRLRSHFDEAGWVDEMLGGVQYLFFLRELVGAVQDNWQSVLAKLEMLKNTLINRNMMITNVTLEAENWQQFRPYLESFLGKLPAQPAVLENWNVDTPTQYEGLTIPAQVNYVGKGANLYNLGYELNGSINVISNYLRTTWLWERVRIQGGAYGVFSLFDRHSGVFTFLSYRDPNLLKTLENYDSTAQFLQQLELEKDELTKSIIGAIGSFDSYMLPDARGYTSMVRYLINYSDEVRQTWRDQILNTKAEDFRNLGNILEQINKTGRVVVLGSQDAIQTANQSNKDWLQVVKVM
jgi:Zn-dependent M16 (insulinase) family peptidase